MPVDFGAAGHATAAAGPAGGPGVFPGAYQFVRDRLEADFAGWAGSVHNTGRNLFPRHYLLDRVRAGRPVTVRAVSLPARFGGVPAPANHREALVSEHWRHQNKAVTVSPDDSVRPAADNADLYAEYADL